MDCFLKHPYKRFWFFIFFIFTNRDQEGELKKKYPQLQRPFIANPPDSNAVVDIDVKMHGLTEFVTKTLKQAQLSCNLTKHQKSGLKSLQHFSQRQMWRIIR